MTSSAPTNHHTWLQDALCSRLCCLILLEIFTGLSSSQGSTEMALVTGYAEQEFTEYICLLDEQASTQGAPSSGWMGSSSFL